MDSASFRRIVASVSVRVLTPLLDDWVSLGHLLDDILRTVPPQCEVSMLVVDDGSNEPMPPGIRDRAARFVSVDQIVLKRNLGHQRAIAIGLIQSLSLHDVDYTVVMDSDGEDPGSEIWRLLDIAEASPGAIVVASRGNRHESRSFKFAYWAYKIIFRLLTGASISFGNFCVLPNASVSQVALSESIWTHFAATVARSRSPIVQERVDRDRRFDGESRMNTSALVNHGLGAISTYSDRLFVRLVAVSLGLLVMATLALGSVLIIRAVTDWGVPGWATSAAGIAVIISIQLFALIVLITFLVLLQRQTIEVPLDQRADSFIKEIEVLK